MQRRAVGLLEIATTARAIQLAPRATAGMTVGTAIAQPHPAPIGTDGMRAEVPRGVHLARPSSRGDHAGWRAPGRLTARLDTMCTGVTVGLTNETRKGFGLLGALARWRHGLGWILPRHRAIAWPQDMQHEEQPHQPQ